jgi:hypothetical protein
MSKKRKKTSPAEKNVSRVESEPEAEATDSIGVPTPSRNQVLVILLLLVAVAFALRVYRIDQCALHNDEALQLNGIRTETWKALIQHCTSVDMHPPLSYLVQKTVYPLSQSRGALRMPSAVLGALSVPAVLWALLPIFGRRRALIAASLVVTSFSLIWYSRELRDYAFFFFFVTLTFGFYVRILRCQDPFPQWGHVVGFTACNILSTYSHFNTFLTWPVYGLLYLVWDLVHHRRIRWRYAAAFAASAIVLVIAVFPTFVWASKMRDVQGHDKLRPGLHQLYESTAGFGLGTGWPYALWIVLIGVGLYQLLVRDRERDLLVIGWLLVPIVAYLYVYGLPAKFVVNLYRYMIILQLGLIAILASGIDGLSLWIGRRRPLAGTALCVLSPVLLMGAIAPAYTTYYSMRSCGHLFDDIQSHLEDLDSRAMILDNYYEMQYLKHYLPSQIRVAHAPIWNNEREFTQMRAAEFVRRSAEAEPLMAFYDSQASRMSSPGEWDWMNTHFQHHRKFVNHEAKYLHERGLNLFPILFRSWGMQKISVHHNPKSGLDGWFARRGVPLDAVYGERWNHVTLMNLSSTWEHWRVTDKAATILLYNAADVDVPASLTLRVHGCVAGQELTVRHGLEVLVERHTLRNGPPDGFDFRSKQRFRQYVPLGSLASRGGGPVSIPAALQLSFEDVRADQVSIPPGVSEWLVECRAPEGIVLGGLRVEPRR